jgi:hypothetical protein
MDPSCRLGVSIKLNPSLADGLLPSSYFVMHQIGEVEASLSLSAVFWMGSKDSLRLLSPSASCIVERRSSIFGSGYLRRHRIGARRAARCLLWFVVIEV